MENRDTLYANLVAYAEAATYINGRMATRYEVVKLLVKQFDEISREHLDLVEKLCADGFINK